MSLTALRSKKGPARQHALLSHVQYHGFLAGDLDRRSRAVAQDGTGEWRYIGNGTARWIGLIFAYDPEALFAAVIPAHDHGQTKRCVPLVRRRLNDFCVRTPRSPVAHFPQGGSSSFPVAFVCCGLVRRLETAESGLDCCKPSFGNEIAVRRYRPVRKFGRLVFSLLDERSAHGSYRCCTGFRFALSASIRLDASAFVRSG
jgi:hypothetical protein